MELRALIRLASEIIAYYWPMRTFVHHNPLHGLEGLHFEKAAPRGRAFPARQRHIWPTKYFVLISLPAEFGAQHLDAVLETHGGNEQVALGARTVSHLEVLRALDDSGHFGASTREAGPRL